MFLRTAHHQAYFTCISRCFSITFHVVDDCVIHYGSAFVSEADGSFVSGVH